MNERSIYERIGGEQAVIHLVDKFYDRVLGDESLASFFENIPVDSLKSMQKEFFTIALGGPGEYSGRSLSHAHQGRGIHTKHFQAFVQHLFETLKELDLTEDERYQIISEIDLYVDDVTDDSVAPLGQ